MNQKVIEELRITAEIFSKSLSLPAAKALLNDLANYDADKIIAALRHCRKTMRSFPVPNDLISVIENQDGRPGVEEAWAMIPKEEYESVVWTQEMSDAFGVAYKFLKEGDKVAARMAFKEVYEKNVKRARAQKKPVKWTPSFGWDRTLRNAALIEAIEKERITATDAINYLPTFEANDFKNKLIMSDNSNLNKLIDSTTKKLG